MKYYLIFLFLFVFIPNLSFAEWTLIYESSDSRSKYYANLLDIKVNKKFSKLRLWTIEDFNLLQEVASYKYLSVKTVERKIVRNELKIILKV